MVLLRDVGQVETHFGPFGDSVNLSARKVHGLRRIYHGHGNHFRRTRWNSKATWVKGKLVSVYLEIVLISTHDSYVVCTKCTIGSEIILGATDGTPT
jgi:hypothetical protein